MNQKTALPFAIVVAAILIAASIVYKSGKQSEVQIDANAAKAVNNKKEEFSKIEEVVTPVSGVELPVSWNDLGLRLIESGAIDKEKMTALYSRRGAYGYAEEKLLTKSNNGRLVITRDNSGYILNLLWPLGLASKNPILDSGDMVNPKYGGAGNFAATGGWSLAVGDAMDHYSRHRFFNLTVADQAKVERVAKGIYRPCCNNSTYFPDCNHGMAMLGLLELMAAQGVSEEDMYKTALKVNSYWFTATYMTIATYFKNQGVAWKDVDAKEVLGLNYSSAYGYRRLLDQVSAPKDPGDGVSCGVDEGVEAVPRREQGGCGV